LKFLRTQHPTVLLLFNRFSTISSGRGIPVTSTPTSISSS